MKKTQKKKMTKTTATKTKKIMILTLTGQKDNFGLNGSDDPSQQKTHVQDMNEDGQTLGWMGGWTDGHGLITIKSKYKQ